MQRRCAAHDYTLPGIYHITINVADSQAHPLGRVVGSLNAPDGTPEAPHVALTPAGRMVEDELLRSIAAHYPMIEVQDYVVMPEHLHVIIEAHDRIVSKAGRQTHLGQVIAGFKKGCNRRYWQLTGQESPLLHTSPHQGEPDATNGAPIPPAPAGAPAVVTTPAPVGVPAVFPQAEPSPSRKVSSSATTGRTPLFAPGYCDVMPLRQGQLAQQRAYIHSNPRSRLLRDSHPSWLYTQRGGINTALTPAALRRFLMSECGQALSRPGAWEELADRLLMAPGGTITCDTYGSRALLSGHRLLPVVCHRSDARRWPDQKAACMKAAAQGAVLVSARIAKGEQDIIDTALGQGLPAVIIVANGFPDRYHPSEVRLAQCAGGQTLLATPWLYQYSQHDAAVSVPFCKAMNAVAQALCRQADRWWQEA